MAPELSLKNPVFECFAFYVTVVILKMLVMIFPTIYLRFANKAFSNEEDVERYKGKVAITTSNPAVERVRRNHLNDMENIIPFVLIGFLYVLTDPTLAAAKLHFRVFAIARIMHTLAYQLALPQPSRFLAFLAGLLVTFSMAYSVICSTIKAF